MQTVKPMPTTEQKSTLPAGLKYRWQPQEPVSPEEYLRRERLSLEKSEYYGGRPHPLYPPENEIGEKMPGGTRNHNRLASNVHGELYVALRNTECSVFGSDMRIGVRPGETFYYPDVTVVCGEEQYVKGESQANLLNPALIVEVLSSSTEQNDRGEKFAAYRTLDALSEYMLVSQERRQVEVFRKNETGHWVLYEFDAGARNVELATGGVRLSMEALYEDVKFENDQTR
jgi:Uma2 family endonuclease